MATPALLAPDALTAALLGSLAAVLLWEAMAPCRPPALDRNARWALNFALLGIGVATVGMVVPVSLVALASHAETRDWGVFHFATMRSELVVVFSVLVMDLGKYLQHWAMHRFSWLWRMHRLHHSDTDMDVTTSFRFHPLELIFTLLADAALVVAFGVAPAVVAGYRLVRVCVSSFAHGNVRLPVRAAAWVSRVFVTPDFHRRHHSVVVAEQAGNLSGGLVWWDRWFGTALPPSDTDPRTMPLGLDGPAGTHVHSLPRALIEPFANERRHPA